MAKSKKSSESPPNGTNGNGHISSTNGYRHPWTENSLKVVDAWVRPWAYLVQPDKGAKYDDLEALRKYLDPEDTLTASGKEREREAIKFTEARRQVADGESRTIMGAEIQYMRRPAVDRLVENWAKKLAGKYGDSGQYEERRENLHSCVLKWVKSIHEAIAKRVEQGDCPTTTRRLSRTPDEKNVALVRELHERLAFQSKGNTPPSQLVVALAQDLLESLESNKVEIPVVPLDIKEPGEVMAFLRSGSGRKEVKEPQLVRGADFGANAFRTIDLGTSWGIGPRPQHLLIASIKNLCEGNPLRGFDPTEYVAIYDTDGLGNSTLGKGVVLGWAKPLGASKPLEYIKREAEQLGLLNHYFKPGPGSGGVTGNIETDILVEYKPQGDFQKSEAAQRVYLANYIQDRLAHAPSPEDRIRVNRILKDIAYTPSIEPEPFYKVHNIRALTLAYLRGNGFVDAGLWADKPSLAQSEVPKNFRESNLFALNCYLEPEKVFVPPDDDVPAEELLRVRSTLVDDNWPIPDLDTAAQFLSRYGGEERRESLETMLGGVLKVTLRFLDMLYQRGLEKAAREAQKDISLSGVS